jgi:hypothetical protein
LQSALSITITCHNDAGILEALSQVELNSYICVVFGPMKADVTHLAYLLRDVSWNEFEREDECVDFKVELQSLLADLATGADEYWLFDLNKLCFVQLNGLGSVHD